VTLFRNDGPKGLLVDDSENSDLGRCSSLEVVDEACGDRCRHDGDYSSSESGLVGGEEGKRQGNPECHYLKLVLENGNEVISAYPTRKF